jgi:hypothetical protein
MVTALDGNNCFLRDFAFRLEVDQAIDAGIGSFFLDSSEEIVG